MVLRPPWTVDVRRCDANRAGRAPDGAHRTRSISGNLTLRLAHLTNKQAKVRRWPRRANGRAAREGSGSRYASDHDQAYPLSGQRPAIRFGSAHGHDEVHFTVSGALRWHMSSLEPQNIVHASMLPGAPSAGRRSVPPSSATSREGQGPESAFEQAPIRMQPPRIAARKQGTTYIVAAHRSRVHPELWSKYSARAGSHVERDRRSRCPIAHLHPGRPPLLR